MPARVLLTGASGFVGGRLHDPLVAAGFDVRCLSRDASKARRGRSAWEWVDGDVSEPDRLLAAMTGCQIAYYLVHGLKGAPKGWALRELGAAACFADTAYKAGVRRIIYLGGMAPRGEPSEHLRARLQTGHLLRTGEVPCRELRASMIIGRGSASWRMVRDLSARLPVMVLPAWLRHVTEPVGIDDVVSALVKAATMPLTESGWDDLPGPERMSGREILVRVAALFNHSPRVMEVPFVSPRLSSYWIKLVSGVDYPLARELVSGMTADIVAERHDFWERAGLPPPVSLEIAARRALLEEEWSASAKTRLVEGFADLVTRRLPQRG